MCLGTLYYISIFTTATEAGSDVSRYTFSKVPIQKRPNKTDKRGLIRLTKET
jgi:hypothetical protein